MLGLMIALALLIIGRITNNIILIVIGMCFCFVFGLFTSYKIGGYELMYIFVLSMIVVLAILGLILKLLK
jgi:hypothetical protein